jgi:hypothetical protein
MSVTAQTAYAVVELFHAHLSFCSLPEPDFDRVHHRTRLRHVLPLHVSNSLFAHHAQYVAESHAESVSRRTTPPGWALVICIHVGDAA